MLRVSQLHIKNVGPFAEQTFDFSIETGNPDIHIFTGPNGTGKTTILHGIASAFDYFENGHKEHLSNSFYKRFHFFEEDSKEMSKSYVHTILSEKSKNKVIDKIISYGCANCGNLHQNYEKTRANNNDIANRGKAYKDSPFESTLLNYKIDIVKKGNKNRKNKFAVFGYSGYRLISSAGIRIGENNFNPLHLALEFVKKNKDNASISNWIISRYSKAAIEETYGNAALAEKYRQSLNLFMDSIAELTENEYTFKIKTNPWKVVAIYHGKELEFDVLPDGLRSIMSWLGDLLMRLDEISWENAEIPVNEQDIILLLDEIEVHLHPKWQYRILPFIKKIFPNAQIFLTTHSPFILNAIDKAKIYTLKDEKGASVLSQTLLSETGNSYSYVYKYILETNHRFGIETVKDLKRFNEIDQELIRSNFTNEDEFREIISRLRKEGEEVTSLIGSKLFRLKRALGKNYFN